MWVRPLQNWTNRQRSVPTKVPGTRGTFWVPGNTGYRYTGFFSHDSGCRRGGRGPSSVQDRMPQIEETQSTLIHTINFNYSFEVHDRVCVSSTMRLIPNHERTRTRDKSKPLHLVQRTMCRHAPDRPCVASGGVLSTWHTPMQNGGPN